MSKNDLMKRCDDRRQLSIKNWKSLQWSCSYCNEKFNGFITLQSHLQTLHEIDSPANINYSCYNCKKQISGYAAFLNHIRSLHYEKLKLCCDVCSEVYTDYEQLALHRDTHTGSENNIFPNVHHCTLCEVVDTTEKALKNHIRNAHNLPRVALNEENENKRLVAAPQLKVENSVVEPVQCKDEYDETEQLFQCGKCVQNFTNAIELENHKTLHNKINSSESGTLKHDANQDEKTHVSSHPTEYAFICHLCKMVFKRSYYLAVHMRTHNSNFSYNCYICEKVFNDKNDLATHACIHNDERPFKCKKCPKTFKHIGHLKKHKCIKVTEKTPFECEICKKVYVKKKAWQKHKCIKVTEKTPFECEICKKVYDKKKAWQTHLNEHINTNKSVFKCSFCPKSYIWKCRLNAHMRTHTGEHPFTCEMCGKIVSSLEKLKKHTCLHPGKNSFRCEICDKKFCQRKMLNKHMATSHSDVPFNKCEICEKRFKGKEEKLIHMRVHTG